MPISEPAPEPTAPTPTPEPTSDPTTGLTPDPAPVPDAAEARTGNPLWLSWAIAAVVVAGLAGAALFLPG